MVITKKPSGWYGAFKCVAADGAKFTKWSPPLGTLRRGVGVARL